VPSLARWIAAVLAVVLVVGGAAEALSSLYYSAAHHSRRAKDLTRVEAAAAMAARVLPASQQARALNGRVAALKGDSGAVLHEYAAVMQQAPTDAFRWAELAQSLAVAGDFSSYLTLAIAQAQQLAPNSSGVNAALARIAWLYVEKLDDAQRALLESSMQRTLNYKPERYKLFEFVARARRHHVFCEEFGLRMGAKHWCGRIDRELAHCFSKKIRPAERRWCQRLEVLP